MEAVGEASRLSSSPMTPSPSTFCVFKRPGFSKIKFWTPLSGVASVDGMLVSRLGFLSDCGAVTQGAAILVKDGHGFGVTRVDYPANTPKGRVTAVALE
eukprot:7877629-Pyramimonas_sp.AAC.1